MRVLVVEDDPDLRRQLAEALGDTGYVVDVADNGEDGHHLGDTEPYDAVILDLGLPVIDGVAAAVKMVEGLVAQSLKTSKVGGYSWPPDMAYTGEFVNDRFS